jgi:hypothetical protein
MFTPTLRRADGNTRSTTKTTTSTKEDRTPLGSNSPKVGSPAEGRRLGWGAIRVGKQPLIVGCLPTPIAPQPNRASRGPTVQ